MKVLIIIAGITAAVGIVLFVGILGLAAVCKAVTTIQRGDY